jgi:hypothetical protein
MGPAPRTETPDPGDPAPGYGSAPRSLQGEGGFKPTGQWFSHQLRDGSGGWLIGGGNTNDTIVGTTHDDIISSGKGNDTITGNDGNDTFRFYAGDGEDRITDFHQGDHLQFFGTAGMHAMILPINGPPLPGQPAHSDIGWQVLYSEGSGGSTENGVRLDGITNADLPWVQASIEYVIA